jgi:hypothetical protein
MIGTLAFEQRTPNPFDGDATRPGTMYGPFIALAADGDVFNVIKEAWSKAGGH